MSKQKNALLAVAIIFLTIASCINTWLIRRTYTKAQGYVNQQIAANCPKYQMLVSHSVFQEEIDRIDQDFEQLASTTNWVLDDILGYDIPQ